MNRTQTDEPRVAVLSSDHGGHLQTLLEDPVVRPWIALVVADRSDAYALSHADWHGIAAVALRAGKSYLDLYDLTLLRVLEEHRIDYVVVAGFPRIVGTETVHAYPDRVMKLHHSLLPAFPGPDPVAQALEHGVTQTGVTVHLIGKDLEAGPILLQESLEIHDGDTWHSLVERIHQVEVQILPAAVRAFVEGSSGAGRGSEPPPD